MKTSLIVLLTGIVAFAAGRMSAPKPPSSTSVSIASVPVPTVPPRAASIQLLDTPSHRAGEDSWASVIRKPRTPQTERAMCEYLQDLAGKDPTAALNLASAETNRQLREKLQDAVLRGWAAKQPEAAAAWAMALPVAQRDLALQNVFSGAASPQIALNLGSKLCAENPSQSSNFGHALLAALNETGAFDLAAQFSLERPELRSALVGPAYYEWAQHQPEAALASVNSIKDRDARDEAFRGMISGWSAANPPAVAEFAANMPPGKERSETLADALPRWASEDPAAASKWINDFAPDRDFDEGKSSIATSPAVFLQSPKSAAGWAESIVDPTMRSNTLDAVISEWARTDPEAAKQYIQSNSKLPPNEKAALLQQFNPKSAAPGT